MNALHELAPRPATALRTLLALACASVAPCAMANAGGQDVTLPASAPASAMVPATPPGADTVLRYQCTFIDGTTRLLLEDPRDRHPGLAQDCTLVPMRLQPVLVAEAPEPPPWLGFSAQWVHAQRGASAPAAAAPLRDEARAAAMAAARMPAHLASWIEAASAKHQLDPTLVSALIYVESRYRPDARSPKGALGLMQLMPATAARYGVRTDTELLDPRVNIEVGVRHLRRLHDRYDGRLDLILAAYNAGEGAVDRYGKRIPPFTETQDYVRRISTLAGVPEISRTP